MDGKFIAYYRVSTDRQGMNGNGMTAQRKAVEDYLNGGRWKLVGEFTEVESGKRSDRPELEKALMACRKDKAKLVIAKLDRLSRNVHFIQRPERAQGRFRGLRHAERQRFHDQRLCRGRPHQGRPCGSQGARRQARRPATARNQRNAPGGRPRASTGHCADSLGIDRHVRPCRGCRVECAPDRNAKRRTVICQDRHPCAR
jgi:hypothetical protein